jgi:hypothetical protein
MPHWCDAHSGALELIAIPGIDPATALLLSDAAAAALEPNLSRRDRERAESDLSHVLDAVGAMLPGSPTRWTRSEREPASAGDCTTMRWPPLARCAAAIP